MKRISATVIAVIFFAVLAASASAAPWNRGAGKGYGYRADMTDISKKLDLTTEQTTSIKALRDAHLKDVKPLHDKMYAKRGDLRLLWLEKTPDQAKIVALQKEIRALRDQMDDKATSHRFAAVNILTPAQKEKLQTSFRGRGQGRGAGLGPMDCPSDYRGAGLRDRPGRGMRGNW
jgi:Spy/CpxP family protein refolding chaperone